MAVAGSVAGEEGDTPSADVAHVERARRQTVGGVDVDLVDTGEQVVEPGAAEDPDLGVLRGHQLALAVLAVPEEEPFEEPEEEPFEEPAPSFEEPAPSFEAPEVSFEEEPLEPAPSEDGVRSAPDVELLAAEELSWLELPDELLEGVRLSVL
jgi:hypothetical protein